MRISIFDKDFKNEWMPYLNGEPLNDCVEFDTDRCWALVYCRDENDKLLPDKDGNLKTKTVSGAITAKRTKKTKKA